MLAHTQLIEIADDVNSSENEMAIMTHAMRSMSHESQEILVLVCIKQFSYETVSEILNLPVFAVRTRLSRARAELASLMMTPVEDYSMAGIIQLQRTN